MNCHVPPTTVSLSFPVLTTHHCLPLLPCTHHSPSPSLYSPLSPSFPVLTTVSLLPYTHHSPSPSLALTTVSLSFPCTHHCCPIAEMQTIEQEKTSAALSEKRKQTPVVGDMHALVATLPDILESANPVQ